MPAAKNFAFVAGQDDYLVDRLGHERFAAIAVEVTDEFSREIISGFAANQDEVATAINRFRDAVQTVPMFGGKCAVWLKDVNFLADTPTGRADGTLALVEDLKAVLAAVNPAQTAALVTAAPVDRRRSFLKWCEQNADFALADGGGGEALPGLVIAEAKTLGATFAPGAIELLLTRIGPNSRLLIEETRKLASYAGSFSQPAKIEEAHVAELTANVAEGDFFELAEAFISGDLKWTLDALHRHFFAGGDSRPALAAMQNRNRLLLQLRALIDTGAVRAGLRGVEGLAAASAAYRDKFGDAAETKSAYNIFTQNAWYLSKLAGNGRPPTLRRLIDNQQEFIAAFEEVIRRPDEQEEVLREMTVRCLA